VYFAVQNSKLETQFCNAAFFRIFKNQVREKEQNNRPEHFILKDRFVAVVRSQQQRASS
jgi:hypothetical protein